ncbi:MAG: hypothetical protein ACOC0X_07270 [Halobacteriota archaeon]
MISRAAIAAGALAGLVYLGLYGAYAVASGWDIPAWAAIALGAGVVIGSAITTEVLVAAIEERAPSQDI